MDTALRTFGIIALVCVTLAGVALLVIGIREAPSILQYVRMRRM